MLKKDILRSKEDFTGIYKKGRSIGERHIVLFYKKNNLQYNRIAFLASKKVETALKETEPKGLWKKIIDF